MQEQQDLQGPLKEILRKKWWHRAFIVINVLFSFFLFIVSAIVTSDQGDNIKNTTKIVSLREFTISHPGDVDTVPSFLREAQSKYKIGCFEDNKIQHLYSSDLRETFCNANLTENLFSLTKTITEKNYKDTDHNALYMELSELIKEDKEKRYCFVPNLVNCHSANIYLFEEKTWYRYGYAFLMSLLILIGWALISRLAYYKGLIYIIYGRTK